MIIEYLKSGLLIKRSDQPECFSLEKMPESDEGSLDQQHSNQQIPPQSTGEQSSPAAAKKKPKKARFNVIS